MLRSHNCGELRIEQVNETVSLCGWVQKVRDQGGMIWIDLRDRYGITQLKLEEGNTNSVLRETARSLGREFVINARGVVIERVSKNDNIPTGEIEIDVKTLEILNKSNVPPFIIETETDGGEELRMKYRYLDLRRPPIQENLQLRHRLMNYTRSYLTDLEFIEVETPSLIKSTPEGARDFVVPSRINPGQFYALPQSPQIFKQLLMISGFDKYFQIVKCFRDEDLRADRQPEFTQIDCEMSFVSREDILEVFENLVKHLFKEEKGIELDDFQRMEYDNAISNYGTDKPDLRFDMKFHELNDIVQGKGFRVFEEAELVVGICVSGGAEYSRKQIDELTDFVKRPQIGANGLVYIKCNSDGTFKSSVDKFYSEDELKTISESINASAGDLILIMAGDSYKTRSALSELRLEMGNRLNLPDKDIFAPLWVINFPLLEWNENEKRFFAMHHPFTSPIEDDIPLLESDPGKAKANAYDMVINGVELGGGSIRIYNRELQNQMFKVLGFSEKEAENQFGFLLNAFDYGAPPHGGIAFGFDRICALFGGTDSIRDYIAFPKNNSGRDLMIDSPSKVSEDILWELKIKSLDK